MRKFTNENLLITIPNRDNSVIGTGEYCSSLQTYSKMLREETLSPAQSRGFDQIEI